MENTIYIKMKIHIKIYILKKDFMYFINSL